jgi:hypothetical protein
VDAQQGALRLRGGALDPSAVRRWVERTCSEQGVEVQIRNPHTLARIATLLAPTREVRVDVPRSGVEAGGVHHWGGATG